jgi:hypothetical protein
MPLGAETYRTEFFDLIKAPAREIVSQLAGLNA